MPQDELNGLAKMTICDEDDRDVRFFYGLPRVGSRVVVTGLQRRRDLQRRRGAIIGRNESSGLYTVRIDDTCYAVHDAVIGTTQINEANLTVLETNITVLGGPFDADLQGRLRVAAAGDLLEYDQWEKIENRVTPGLGGPYGENHTLVAALPFLKQGVLVTEHMAMKMKILLPISDQMPLLDLFVVDGACALAVRTYDPDLYYAQCDGMRQWLELTASSMGLDVTKILIFGTDAVVKESPIGGGEATVEISIDPQSKVLIFSHERGGKILMRLTFLFGLTACLLTRAQTYSFFRDDTERPAHAFWDAENHRITTSKRDLFEAPLQMVGQYMWAGEGYEAFMLGGGPDAGEDELDELDDRLRKLAPSFKSYELERV